MPLFITYLVKLSISLAIVWLFYQFVLRKLTFYNSNRWYLLGYTLLCFFIPFINISPVLQQNEWVHSTPVSWVPVIENYRITETTTASSPGFFTTWNTIMLLVATGMLMMLFRLLFQLISFRRMMHKARAIPGKNVNLFQVDEEIIPFSFGNSIFLNQNLHTADELQEIIRHEFVHVKQKHSIDIIWGELLCLFNWYNPFAWLLKRSIRQNLEFIADNKVLENGMDKKQYQYLLLKVIGNNQFSIAPKFNFSSLKKRIAMMNKLKTAKLHLVRFLFILPLLAVILLSFRKQIGDSFKHDKQKEQIINLKGDFTDTVPEVMELNSKGYFIDIKGKDGNCVVVVKDKKRREVERVLLTKWKEKQEYYDNLYGEIPLPPPTESFVVSEPLTVAEMPENVKRIHVGDDLLAEVWLNDGKKETYDLSVPSQSEAFQKKYGRLATIAPQRVVGGPDFRLKEFLERNESVKNLGWVFNNYQENIPVIMYVLKKDGSEEKYKLDDPADKARAEKKYGELPLPRSVGIMPPARVDGYELSEATEITGTINPIKANGYELKAVTEIKESGEPITVTGHGLTKVSVANESIEPITVTGHSLTAAQEVNRSKIGEHFEINDNKASIRLKDGSVEEYDLTKESEKKKFETKYGKIIEVGETVNGVRSPVKAIGTMDGQTVLAPARIQGEGGVTFLNDEGNIISGEEEVLVTITKKTTQQELDAFVRELKEKGFELKFDKVKYDNGKLVRISGTIKYKDGHGSFEETDFNKLIISTIKDGDKFHLKIESVVKKVS